MALGTQESSHGVHGAPKSGFQISLRLVIDQCTSPEACAVEVLVRAAYKDRGLGGAPEKCETVGAHRRDVGGEDKRCGGIYEHSVVLCS